MRFHSGRRGYGGFARGKDMTSLSQTVEKHGWQGTEEKVVGSVECPFEICDH